MPKIASLGPRAALPSKQPREKSSISEQPAIDSGHQRSAATENARYENPAPLGSGVPRWGGSHEVVDATAPMPTRCGCGSGN